MALYYYMGTNTSRRRVEGFVAGETDGEAYAELEKRAVLDPKIREVADLRGFEYKLFPPLKVHKLSRKNIAYFFTQMGFLIKSGITTYDSIDVLCVSVNTEVAQFCRHLKYSISQGVPFSEALNQTKLIPADIVEKVRAGENSNSMSDTLEKIANKLKEELELTSNIRAGMAYPTFSLVMIFGIAMFMLTVLVPQIGGIVADFGAELPAITVGMMKISEFVTNFWWLILIGTAAIVVLHIQLRKHNRLYRLTSDRLRYKYPVLGKIWKKLHILYLSSVMSQLMDSGKNTADSIILAKETVTNTYLKDAISKTEFNIIRRGMNLYEAMQQFEVYPPEFLQLIAIGVRTGNVAETLDNIYKQYRYEVNDEIKTAIDLIQPISFIILGVIAGVFIFGMYSAIYSVFDAV